MLFSVHENPDPQCSDIRDYDHRLDLSSSSSSSSSTFSIRDYVFSARRKKDIKKSWPFSLKNLKLCLKHGVKDVLPPFQSVDEIRNQIHHDLNPQMSDKKEELLPVKKKLDEKVVARFQTSTISTTLFRGSKSKSKVNSSSSPEDIIGSEAMASSKICPVCKTFSSSSNTTLNAHIDQCLSAESSTPKWNGIDSSKLLGPRHRVKPRKTRLMVDIYVTAFPCTLEDLDRRNGSNWASGGPSNFPSPDTEESEAKCDDIEKEKEKNDDADVDVDVGEVYIDSSGIKIRILSKPDELISDKPCFSKLVDHLRARKPFKIISARKKMKNKKRCSSKLIHYLQLAQKKKLRARSSQVCVGDSGENRQIGERILDVVEDLNNETGNNSETLSHWARSKRSDLSKKLENNNNNNLNSVPETCRDLSPENICYEAREMQLAEKDEKRSSLLVEGSLITPKKRRLRKERTPRMLKSASFSNHVLDPVDTCDSQLSTSVEFHRSKSMRVTEPKSDMFPRRDREEDRVFLPWDRSTFGKNPSEVLPFHRETVDSEIATLAEVKDREMFYGVRLGNILTEDLNNALFPEADPIQIPGPPGSFLPSPRDMSSEDFQGNCSSLTTSRVHSSQDHRGGDSPENSPASATSTVSDSTAGRYEENNNKERLFVSDEPCCCHRRKDNNNTRGIFHDPTAVMTMTNSRDSSQLLQRRSGIACLDTPSTITSPSNPVLRLMGKNLMVGNRDHQDEPQRSSVVPAGNGWAPPTSHQTGQPYSHMYKCHNNNFL